MLHLAGLAVSGLLTLALWRVGSLLLARLRADLKFERAASLAAGDRHFERALGTVLALRGTIPANAPWTRPEFYE